MILFLILLAIILYNTCELFENNVVQKITIYQITDKQDKKIYDVCPYTYRQNILKALLDRGFIQHNVGYLSKFFSDKKETMYFTDLTKTKLFKVNLYYNAPANSVKFNLM